MPKPRNERADKEAEAAWEQQPRHRLGTNPKDKLKEGYEEGLPVRDQDGQWKRVQKKKKKKQGEDGEEDADAVATTSEAPAAAAAVEVESPAEKRAAIAKLATQILEAPHKHVGLVGDLHQYVKRDRSPAIQRVALLSAVAVLRDLIPAYRIRPLTEKELKMQVSKEVEVLREFERKLLAHYEQAVATLQKWAKSELEGHRAAAVRGLCTLLVKGYDFNMRDELIQAIVPIANSGDAEARGAACEALVSLFEGDTHGEATLKAVQVSSNLLRHSSFNVQPELLATWLRLKVDAATSTAAGEPSNRRAKKRKRSLDPVARELAAAAGERGNLALQQSRILENVFVSYARVVKRGASSPLLPAVLKGIAKFAHQVNVELLLDLFSNLRGLLNSSDALSDGSRLMCIHALLQLLSGHGAALAVDAKDVQRHLYALFTRRALLEQPQMLATALDCVEHLCGKGRSQLLAPRAASMVRRLLGLAGSVPPAQAIALLCASSRLLVACPRIGTMFEPPEGGAPMIAVGGFGYNFGAGAGSVWGRGKKRVAAGADDDDDESSATVTEEGGDIDSPAAIHSTAWQLAELRRHYHPTVRELAAKLAAREPFPNNFLRATPQSIMNTYSDANGAFHPAPHQPKAHRLAAGAKAAAENGKPMPTLGAVPSSSMGSVREAEASARAAAGAPCSLRFLKA